MARAVDSRPACCSPFGMFNSISMHLVGKSEQKPVRRNAANFPSFCVPLCALQQTLDSILDI